MGKLFPFLVYLCLFSALMLVRANGRQCTEDIILINDSGCASPCCYQSPANSGHYVFNHTSVEKIDIRGNANVLSVSFPNLTYVEKYIRISYNQPGAVASISFPKLQTAANIEIVNNPGLEAVDFPRLMAVDSYDYNARLKIQSNANLASFNAPMLERISANEDGTAFMEFRYNHALETLDFPILRTVETNDDYGEAYVFISRNDMLRSVSMDRLMRLSAGVDAISYLIIDDLPELASISFSNLVEILPAGGPDDFSELTVGHNPRLLEFAFPRLERVSLLQLSSLQGTRKAMFPNLAELDYFWAFRNCADPASSLKLYICNQTPIMDFYLAGDSSCGPAGYQLYTPDATNTAECDASPICESFTPEITDCHCGSPGLCTPNPN